MSGRLFMSSAVTVVIVVVVAAVIVTNVCCVCWQKFYLLSEIKKKTVSASVQASVCLFDHSFNQPACQPSVHPVCNNVCCLFCYHVSFSTAPSAYVLPMKHILRATITIITKCPDRPDKPAKGEEKKLLW